MAKKLLAALVLSASVSAPSAHAENTVKQSAAEPIHGVASFYAHKFEGRRTANGETFRHAALTAAHASLPFGTIALITNVTTGNYVIVRITDRLPSKKTLIDLTRTAASELGIISSGRARVSLQVLEPPKAGERAAATESVEFR
jgi:rare lipoprotein A